MKDIFTWLLAHRGSNIGAANEDNRVAWLRQALCKVPQGSRILDAGAGTQRFKSLCSHLNYVSQDFGQYDGKGDAIGLHTGSFDYGALDILSDITCIPEPEASFDAIMCIEVLEHLPSPELAIQEFARLLKKNGQLIITAPFCSLTHYAPYHYVTGFNKYFYEYHLPKYGFAITELCENGDYFTYLAQEVRRLESVATCYTNTKLTQIEKLCLMFCLLVLNRLSGKDRKSSELLCFGYMIQATRL